MSVLDRVRWVELPSVTDARGVLTSVEGVRDVPFEIRRVFYMHHIVTDRGGHAHRDTDQVVVAAAGCFTMKLSDGERSAVYRLDDPRRGVYTPPMVFIELSDFSPGAVCLVLASTPYDMSRSIRSWEEYLAAKRGG
jgi:hypothetical protein